MASENYKLGKASMPDGNMSRAIGGALDFGVLWPGSLRSFAVWFPV